MRRMRVPHPPHAVVGLVSQRDKAPTQNIEAYQLYLQGREIWKRRGEENLRRVGRWKG